MATNYSPRVVTDGLVLYLDAANPKSYSGSGTTWSDLSGNGNDGRLVNGVGYSSDDLGSLTFDGVDDVCFVDALASYDFSNGITAIASHYNVGGQYRGLFGNGYSSNGCFEMRYGRENFFTGESNNGTRLSCAITSASNTRASLTINAERDKWGIYCMTYNNSVLNVFKNGLLFNSVNSSISLKVSPYPVTVGAAVWQTPGNDEVRELLIGKTPFVMLYNRALTADEISQNFQAIRGRYGI